MQQLINPKTLLVVCIYLMKSTINYENTPGESGTVPLVLLAHESGDEIIGLGIILEDVIEFTMEMGFLGEAINELLEIHLTLDK